MICKDVHTLISPVLLQDPGLTAAEQLAFFAHLDTCTRCTEEFQRHSDLYVSEPSENHGEQSGERAGLGIPPEHLTSGAPRLMTESEGWADLLSRCPELACSYNNERQRERIREALRHVRVAGLVAACLLMLVWLGWRAGARWARSASNPNSVAAALIDPAGRATQAASAADSKTLGLAPPPIASRDLHRIDYASWREQHQTWFSAQFPWVFTAQATLARHGVDADYIELLMISGDLWQFHFDPNHLMDAPLACNDSKGIQRLAAYYNLPASELMAIGAVGSSLPHDPAQDCRAWHDSVASASDTEGQGQTNLLLFSLRAGNYMAMTRTAAVLWADRHPQGQIRPPAPTALASSEQARDRTASIDVLKRQFGAAQQIMQAAQDLLTLPETDQCSPNAKPHWKQLEAGIADLSPEGRRPS